MVNETHLRRAQKALRAFHVVVPFKYVADIRRAVSRFLGVCSHAPCPKPQGRRTATAIGPYDLGDWPI